MLDPSTKFCCAAPTRKVRDSIVADFLAVVQSPCTALYNSTMKGIQTAAISDQLFLKLNTASKALCLGFLFLPKLKLHQNETGIY